MTSLPVPDVGNWSFVPDESAKGNLRHLRCLIRPPKKQKAELRAVALTLPPAATRPSSEEDELEEELQNESTSLTGLKTRSFPYPAHAGNGLTFFFSPWEP